MAKTLYLLRHAQALSSGISGDFDRPLSPKGQDDAQKLAQHMLEKSYSPDALLCSSALRTRETSVPICGTFKDMHVQYSKDIYSADYNDLLEMVKKTGDEVDSLMIIGHNPTIYEFAASLSDEGEPEMLQALTRGYVPATLSVIEIDTQKWSDVKPTACVLKDIVIPAH